MQFLKGVISDRLRQKFHPSDTVWTPKRISDSTPMPKSGVKGVRLSDGRRKKS